MLIGLLLFIPLSGLFFVFLIISITFGILRFRSLSQLFNPFHIAVTFFELAEIFVLRSIRGTDTIPVFRGTIEARDGNLYSFQMLGTLNHGQFVTGHHIRLEGDFRKGTFHAKKAYDTTTRSAITTRYRNPWRTVFYLILCIYVVLGIVAAFQVNSGQYNTTYLNNIFYGAFH